ncbi:hypothetical protein [Nocardioides convexus]|uniref:hypothetical protein n=1 Tax=Nocardioides convexus TaxID=2712224 RepID=UPI00241822BE|nr:hypothetical protein [Nocardioides convexus]
MVVRSLANQTSYAVGFALSGIVVATAGPGWAIAVDALTYALAAGCFALIRAEAPTNPAGERLLAESADGAREVLRHSLAVAAHRPGAALPPVLRRGAGRARPDRRRRHVGRAGVGRGDGRPDGGLRDRRPHRAALAPEPPAGLGSADAQPDRGVPARDGAGRRPLAGARRRGGARRRAAGSSASGLGPRHPGERRGGQSSPASTPSTWSARSCAARSAWP